MKTPRKVVDVSVPLSRDIPVWPGDPGFKLERVSDLHAGDDVTVSKVTMSAHSGTHVDAPAHFFEEGATVDDIPLEAFMGEVWVAEMGDVRTITADHLESLRIPATERLLLKTSNSQRWGGRFHGDYVALDAGAARWVVERGIRLVGIDYLSIQRFEDPPTTHEVLLSAGVVILEGLVLGEVEAGAWELICLPLRLVGAEGAPVRAILREVEART